MLKAEKANGIAKGRGSGKSVHIRMPLQTRY